MDRALAEIWHNPSSIHRPGQAARHELERARSAFARLLNVKPREITFTSGGTESLNLAIRGGLDALAATWRLITTRTEHASVREIAEDLERGAPGRVEWCPLTTDSRIDLDSLESLLTPAPALVCVQWANNETGIVQPIEEIAALCRRRQSILCCDATQWIGKEPCPYPPGDLLVCAPHKFHGPKGVGVLWTDSRIRLRPRLLGTQELGRRGGTENVPGIVGGGIAADEAAAWLDDTSARSRGTALRDLLESLILANVPNAVVHGNDVPRLWNTTNIAFPRLEAEALLLLFSERGLCASAGAACSSGSLDPSPVLLAMGIPEILAHGSIRFSLSRHTTREEIEQAAKIVAESVEILSRSG
jgi:cysteine desulfurase